MINKRATNIFMAIPLILFGCIGMSIIINVIPWGTLSLIAFSFWASFGLWYFIDKNRNE
jgi:hypothetical protein